MQPSWSIVIRAAARSLRSIASCCWRRFQYGALPVLHSSSSDPDPNPNYHVPAGCIHLLYSMALPVPNWSVREPTLTPTSLFIMALSRPPRHTTCTPYTQCRQRS
ncbi:unnamed protein product, partial [Sphacelaria rigidula]